MLWSAFYPDILPQVAGCPNAMVAHYIRQAAIEICERAKRIKADVSFQTVADQPEYALDPGTGMVLVGILDMNIDGKPIYPVSRDELSHNADWQTETGCPERYYTTTAPTQLRLWKTPDAIYTVNAGITVKVARDATGVADWFGDRYHDGLVSGAIARLCALPKREWTDLTLAGIHSGLFEREINKAEAHALKDGTRAPIRTRTYGKA